jgi:translation initiation factor IF-1
MLKLTGTIVENLPNASFRVKTNDEKLYLCHLAGKMRLRRYLRFFPGDRVEFEVAALDQELGRITAKY